ncbi:WYL domain-containing protein [Paucibacter aquatile]|uniref:WYL domain-containing protein n=1 Tax=Kinneretia aquatilis TaxID=2070761 RepID=A0A2N8KYE6_9BURK|nr:WYL domain-containing protein [Paucibacter aquatile]PND38480.1 WYL domain-containing protein [Paucibacter aquatile]
MITSTVNRDRLASLPRTQLERLAYIDFRLYFLGELRRADLIERFGTGPAGATRDIATYREIAKDNLALDPAAKHYTPKDGFEPVFKHDPLRVLTALSQGFGQGLDSDPLSLIRCEFPAALSLPKLDVLAPITRAIHGQKAVRLTYHSTTSGESQKDLVPLSLVDSGVRWHVRAYDRDKAAFHDCVLTRMKNVSILDGPIPPEQTPENDHQWNRVIELELVPHPNFERPEIALMDYDMPDGVLRVRARAANVGYMLRRWSVDCSPDHSLKGKEYTLWLRDPLVLYGASNAVVAPGYKPPVAVNASRVG